MDHDNKIGAFSAVLILVLLILSVVCYLIWPYAAGLTPTEEIFTFAQDQVMAALTALDLGFWIINVIYIFLYLALFRSLRGVNELYATMALVIGLVGVAALISTRPVFEVFALSDLYHAAESAAEKARYLAAGEAILVQFHGSAWYLNMAFSAFSQLILSILMLHSDSFGNTIAYTGIAGSLIALGFWIPGIGIVFTFASMLVFMVWLFLLARTFFQLNRQGS
jgi:hypothetical protein